MSKQSIYQILIQSGMTQAAALGMMGNAQCESNLEANRVQGDFSSFRTLSKSYVARIENGSMSKQDFCFDGKGFGLWQFTFHSRKAALWDFWKSYGGKIDDPVMQTKFAIAELKKDYHSLWETLLTNNDLYTCTKLICEQYERPAHNNIDARYRAALSLKEELAKETEPVKETYWPPRMICKGMSGDDVSVLQALLKAHGFTCEITGDFNVQTHNMTIAYQAQHNLDQDGIAGPKTWASILSMR